jgi:hypothetical protein
MKKQQRALVKEYQRLDRAIAALTVRRKPKAKKVATKRRRRMTKEERAEISRRMLAYHANRRKHAQARKVS